MTQMRTYTLSELIIVALLVTAGTAIVTVAVVPPQSPLDSREMASGQEAIFLLRSREELAPIKRRFGPDRYSRYVEEWAVRHFFEDRRGGVFLDVGAGHYSTESNTYYLEKELGWSGLAVDALPEYAAEYHLHRPRTMFVAMFASDTNGSSTTLFEPAVNKRIASASERFTKAKGELGVRREVPTATLNRLLESAGISRLDFMSMDIELSEPTALAGFDLRKYLPALVCIEVHPEVRQQILDYFAQREYVVVGDYLRIDPTNLYFRPLR